MTDDNEDTEVAPEHEHLVGNDFAKGNDGGAPEGNTNAVGNSGGRPPASNQNAATHHLRSDPFKLLDWLEEKEPDQYEWIMAKHASYLQDAPFEAGTAKADQLKQVATMEYIVWKNRGVQVKDGIVTKTHIKGSDGELVEVEDERPENAAINRMDRQVMSKLKKLGVLDDSESRMADAVESLTSEDYIIDLGDAETEDED